MSEGGEQANKLAGEQASSPATHPPHLLQQGRLRQQVGSGDVQRRQGVGKGGVSGGKHGGLQGAVAQGGGQAGGLHKGGTRGRERGWWE